MAAVLKTVDPQGSGGSNPSSSAKSEGSWSQRDRLFLVSGSGQACLYDVRYRKQPVGPSGPTAAFICFAGPRGERSGMPPPAESLEDEGCAASRYPLAQVSGPDGTGRTGVRRR